MQCPKCKEDMYECKCSQPSFREEARDLFISIYGDLYPEYLEQFLNGIEALHNKHKEEK